jgi:hypothetical protein
MSTIRWAAACALLGGCLTQVDPELSETDTNVETPNRLAANRLAANSLATSRLATAKLTPTGTDLVAMTADPGGRELLTYVVSCALPAGTSLTVSGIIYVGDIGLAPKWTERALSLDERRWVSGCLLARTNLFGVTVQLSMRGSDGPLGVTPAEKAGYSLFEGVFWGDVFAGDLSTMKACTSRYKATNPQISTMPLRECTVADVLVPGKTRCGFTAAGICETVCNDAKAGYRFSKCGGSSQVISVVLAQP